MDKKTHPGVYLLHNVVYGSRLGGLVIKIGSSVDVGTRIISSDYRTILLPQDRPVYIGSIHPKDYETKAEIQHLEKIIHHKLNKIRISPDRELFLDAKISDVTNILTELGVEYELLLEPPKSIYNERMLAAKEYNPMLEKFGGEVVEVEPVTKVFTGKINLSKLIIPSISLKSVKLMDFQVPIHKEVLDYYASGQSKGTLILPCGYGKSYIALSVVNSLMASKHIATAILFVPTVILCEQMFELAEKYVSCKTYQFYGEVDKQAVCQEIYNQSLNPNIVDKRYLIICTYDSGSDLYYVFDYMKTSPDFTIYDEAHNTCVMSKTLQQAAPTRDIIMKPSKYKLFMTATRKIVKSIPREIEIAKVDTLKVKYETPESKSDDVVDDDDTDDDMEDTVDDTVIPTEELVNVISMDNPEYYGEIIKSVNFTYAIEQGIISDYRFVVVNSGTPENVISMAIKDLNIQHMLTYHSSVAGAKDLCSKLNDKGIVAFSIDGSMSSKVRREVLTKFKESKNSVLCSCKVLSEGVNLNHVDSVYFVDPKNSEIDIIQSFARCLRLHPDKSLASIIIENDIQKYSGILKNIVYVDPRVKKNFVKMMLHLDFSKEQIKQNIEDVKYTIVGRSVYTWDVQYNMCLEYEENNRDNKEKKFGHITSKLVYAGYNLGEWLKMQKKNYKGTGNRLLTTDEVIRLGGLRTFMNWLQNPKIKLKPDMMWERKFRLCQQFEKDHEHEKNTKHRLIHYTTNYGGENLGSWLDIQRKNYKGIGRRLLTEVEKQKLFSLETMKDWLIKKKGLLLEEKWDYKYNLLMAYEAKYGVVSNDVKYEGENIYRWLNTQKRCFLGKGQRPLKESEEEKLMRSETWRIWLRNSGHM